MKFDCISWLVPVSPWPIVISIKFLPIISLLDQRKSSTIRNVWRTGRRKYMLISRFKGLTQLFTFLWWTFASLFSFCCHLFSEILESVDFGFIIIIIILNRVSTRYFKPQVGTCMYVHFNLYLHECKLKKSKCNTLLSWFSLFTYTTVMLTKTPILC